MHPSYASQYPGYGLGLALVKQFIDELEGEIHVESQEGSGSIFTCLIPLRMALLPGGEHIHTVESPPELSKKGAIFQSQSSIKRSTPAVLIVEDNLAAQRFVKMIFESLGAVVNTADHGNQALQKAQNHDYALIMMDLGLPEVDGYEVTTKIHQWQREHQHPLSLVVALSAHLGEAERKRCLALGMIRAYEKPLKRETAIELLALMQSPPNSKTYPRGKRHAAH